LPDFTAAVGEITDSSQYMWEWDIPGTLRTMMIHRRRPMRITTVAMLGAVAFSPAAGAVEATINLDAHSVYASEVSVNDYDNVIRGVIVGIPFAAGSRSGEACLAALSPSLDQPIEERRECARRDNARPDQQPAERARRRLAAHHGDPTDPPEVHVDEHDRQLAQEGACHEFGQGQVGDREAEVLDRRRHERIAAG
jgi:hypothetical protein